MALAPLYLKGHYLEPLPEHREEVARSLMAQYLIRQREDMEQAAEDGIRLSCDFIRDRVHGLLHAFTPPTAKTILTMAQVGCKDAFPTGDLLLKVWLHCPEDAEKPNLTSTVVLDDVLIPARFMRSRK
ncbi:MAG: hypothetical protein PHE68_04735 [Candidatus Peribacteraceae bacterium]|nr:hypothetical protein [Candidatus Peribacteraceae bacterium]